MSTFINLQQAFILLLEEHRKIQNHHKVLEVKCQRLSKKCKRLEAENYQAKGYIKCLCGTYNPSEPYDCLKCRKTFCCRCAKTCCACSKNYCPRCDRLDSDDWCLTCSDENL